MNRQQLYQATVRDLSERATRGTEYDLLMTTALLRKLLLDHETNLTDQVHPLARETYQVADTMWRVHQPDETPSTAIWVGMMLLPSVHSGVLSMAGMPVHPDGSPKYTVPEPRQLSRSDFLRTVVCRYDDESYTVEDVIYLVSYVLGGIHAGFSSSAKQKRFQMVASEVEVGASSGLYTTLRGIALATVYAHAPLVKGMAKQGSPVS